MIPDDVFQGGDGWYFWDETDTAYLGPFDNEEDARKASSVYSEYLVTGIVSDPTILGNKSDKIFWHDGEEF